MQLIKGRSLQARFFLGLASIVFFLSLFLGGSLYLHMRDLVYSEVSSKANLVFDQVDAVQSYVRQTLRPRMFNYLPEGDFIIEAMSSSFVTRRVMDRLKQSGKDHLYRRVALGARNPKSELNQLEKELYGYFKKNPGSKGWEGYKNLDEREYFVKARPVVFTRSCLHCHGDPADAPRALLKRYGAKRGFGHTLNELGGLDLVGVPLESSLAMISDATLSYLILYLAGMILFYVMVQFFFNRVVATKLKRLTGFYRERFDDLAGPQLLSRLDEGDEVDEILQGIEEMGQNLHTARQQLQEHADTLEQRVNERTLELSHEVDERKNDVRLFVGLLDGLHQSDTTRKLMAFALERIARRFDLKAIEYLCTFSGTEHYSWPEQKKDHTIPKKVVTEVVGGRAIFQEGETFIPVTSYQEAVQGVLHLVWPGPVRLESKDQEVMLALGQQLGIAIENIRSLHDLLLQRDTLQSIFEGVSDPMALLDGQGKVLVANQAVKGLAAEPGREEAIFRELLLSSGLGVDRAPLAGILGGAQYYKEIERQDGRVFRLTLYPLGDEKEISGRIVAYVREITNEKRMISRMQQNERLVSVGKLAAGLAHEMNNPLGVILCYSDLMKQALSDEQDLKDLEVITRHAKQAQKVLSDLLNFARAKPTATGPLEVGEVLGRVGEVFRVQAESRHCRLKMDLADDPLKIIGNSQALEQILTNLLLNALDAVEPEKGLVKLSGRLSQDHRRVVISVADDGPGVPPENLDLIFDPFFSTKDVGKGSGLGLAVAYGLIHDMGGSIEVQNSGGAVFIVRFPVLDEMGA